VAGDLNIVPAFCFVLLDGGLDVFSLSFPVYVRVILT
jgi:hypothetical protein